jgi:hypothetical protein
MYLEKTILSDVIITKDKKITIKADLHGVIYFGESVSNG